MLPLPRDCTAHQGASYWAWLAPMPNTVAAIDVAKSSRMCRMAGLHWASAATLRRAQLRRHPVPAVRPPAVAAIVGDVVAVFDDHQLDGSLGLARQALGIAVRHDAVELAVHDEERAGDVLRDADQRQRGGVAPR